MLFFGRCCWLCLRRKHFSNFQNASRAFSRNFFLCNRARISLPTSFTVYLYLLLLSYLLLYLLLLSYLLLYLLLLSYLLLSYLLLYLPTTFLPTSLFTYYFLTYFFIYYYFLTYFFIYLLLSYPLLYYSTSFLTHFFIYSTSFLYFKSFLPLSYSTSHFTSNPYLLSYSTSLFTLLCSLHPITYFLTLFSVQSTAFSSFGVWFMVNHNTPLDHKCRSSSINLIFGISSDILPIFIHTSSKLH